MYTRIVKDAFNFHTSTARILGVRADGSKRWTVETTIKEIDCVHYYLGIIAQEYPSLEALRDKALEAGVRSPRPFVLGAALDVTMRRCAIAQVYDFLLHRNADPRGLIEGAYGRGELSFSYKQVLVILEDAEWEGIHYPVWDHENAQELIDTLRACEVDQFVPLIERHAL